MQARLRENLDSMLARIEAASRATGRATPPRLIAVTKSVRPAVALALYELGQRDFGENRLPLLEEKHAAFVAAGADQARWHFIGHLQRNKARRVVALADAIHSLDSLALIEALERHGAEQGRRPMAFLELRLADEANKSGFDEADLEPALARLFGADHLEPAGLMAMAPLVADPAAARQAARATFARLAEIARDLGQRPWSSGRAQLSMGMSGDWEAALETGSDWLRLGTVLFEGLPADALQHGGAA